MDQIQSPLTRSQTRDELRQLAKDSWYTAKRHVHTLPSNYKEIFRRPETVVVSKDKGTRYTTPIESKWPSIDLYLEGICLRDQTKGYNGWTRISFFAVDTINGVIYERSLIDEMNKAGVDDNLAELVFPDLK